MIVKVVVRKRFQATRGVNASTLTMALVGWGLGAMHVRLLGLVCEWFFLTRDLLPFLCGLRPLGLVAWALPVFSSG